MIDMNRVRGVVHDSAPVRPSAGLWAQAATAAAVSKLPKALRPNVPVYHLPLITPLCQACSAVHMSLPWNSRWIHGSMNATDKLLQKQSNNKSSDGNKGCTLAKSLFMFSDSDPVVFPEDVHSRVTTLRSFHKHNGCKNPEHCVQECFFTQSNHVDHLRTHPKRYVDTLASFFKDCVDF